MPVSRLCFTVGFSRNPVLQVNRLSDHVALDFCQRTVDAIGVVNSISIEPLHCCPLSSNKTIWPTQFRCTSYSVSQHSGCLLNCCGCFGHPEIETGQRRVEMIRKQHKKASIALARKEVSKQETTWF